MKKCRVGIVGAAGLTAGELLRILAGHREAVISYLASDSFSGNNTDTVHPQLKNLVDVEIKTYDCKEIAKNCDVVFLAKPHPSSFRYAKELLEEGLKVIDLSGVFRFRDVKVFEDWYGVKHELPELVSESVYGLSELYHEEIRRARLIANPGCYPAGVILGLAPLIREGIVETEGIIIDSTSGFSGAGRSKKNDNNLAANVVGNVRPYRVIDHPHTPEIEQELEKLGRGSKKEIKVTFVPHVAGFERGIISTMYLRLREWGNAMDSRLRGNDKGSRDNKPGLINQTATDKLRKLYSEFYRGKPFVRICGEGKETQIKNVIYTNFCDIGIDVNDRTGTVIVTTALDNLVKGASGQAIQNMNIMMDYDEKEGL
jgi:N-acetyl-gamma-glutamyl-phosphate reductase